MALKVTNLSRNLILVRLASGGSVHLRAGEQCELPDAEVKGNPRVTELVARHLLAVEDVPEPKKARRSSTSEPKSASKSETIFESTPESTPAGSA
jgi:hypothetical protein